MSRESFVARDEAAAWFRDRGVIDPRDSVAAAWAELEAGPTQYGTSMHYPSCRVHGCSGCLPPVLEGEIVEPWIGPGAWAGAVPADPRDREAVFALVRDGIVRVDVPDVR